MICMLICMLIVFYRHWFPVDAGQRFEVDKPRHLCGAVGKSLDCCSFLLIRFRRQNPRPWAVRGGLDQPQQGLRPMCSFLLPAAFGTNQWPSTALLHAVDSFCTGRNTGGVELHHFDR